MDLPVFLTEDDARILQDMISTVKRGRSGPVVAKRVPDDDPPAPEVYVAKPQAPIAAQFDNIPGSGLCDIYQFVSGELRRVPGLTKRVFNLTAAPLPAVWIIIARNKYGAWIANPQHTFARFEMSGDLALGASNAWMVELDPDTSAWVRDDVVTQVYASPGFKGVAYGATQYPDSPFAAIPGHYVEARWDALALKWIAFAGGLEVADAEVTAAIDVGTYTDATPGDEVTINIRRAGPDINGNFAWVSAGAINWVDAVEVGAPVLVLLSLTGHYVVAKLNDGTIVGKTQSFSDTGSLTPVNIWAGRTPGSISDTGVTIYAMNRFLPIGLEASIVGTAQAEEANKWVICKKVQGGWEIVTAQYDYTSLFSETLATIVDQSIQMVGCEFVLTTTFVTATNVPSAPYGLSLWAKTSAEALAAELAPYLDLGTGGDPTDHGALTGLADDDHTQYLLASAATDRSTFATNWAGLTGGGLTSLHTHSPAAPQAGFVSWFAGTAANVPTGWLLCYGQLISRTTYAALFSAIGINYGSGDGSTTFSLPDLRGRTLVGIDNMGGTDAGRLSGGNSVGGVGGTETVTLTTGEMPAHTHGFSQFKFTAGGTNIVRILTDGTGGGITQVSDVTGGGGAHDNMPPYMRGNWCISTGGV